MKKFQDLVNNPRILKESAKPAPIVESPVYRNVPDGSVPDIQSNTSYISDDPQILNHTELAAYIDKSRKPVLIYGTHGIGKTVGVKEQAKKNAAKNKRLYVEIGITEMAESQERIHERVIEAIDYSSGSKDVVERVSVIDILSNVEKYYMLVSGRPPEMHALLFSGIPTEEVQWDQGPPAVDSSDESALAQAAAPGYNDESEGQNRADDLQSHEKSKGLAKKILDAMTPSKSPDQNLSEKRQLKNEQNSIHNIYLESISDLHTEERRTTSIVTPGFFKDIIKSPRGSMYENAMGTIFLDELTRVTEPFFFNLIMSSLERGGGYDETKWKFAAAGNYGHEYIATAITGDEGDQAIGDRVLPVMLKHDPESFLSFASDMMDPPLHEMIAGYIKDSEYKPFDLNWRAQHNIIDPLHGACCFDTSRDTKFFGKTYAQPLTPQKRTLKVNDAQENEDTELLTCLQGCEDMHILKNSVTPRGIEQLNTAQNPSFEEELANYEKALTPYYSQANQEGEDWKSTIEAESMKKDHDRAGKDLRMWLQAQIACGPWTNGLFLYISHKLSVKAGTIDPKHYFGFANKRTPGFDEALAGNIKGLFDPGVASSMAGRDPLIEHGAFQYHGLLDLNSRGQLLIDPQACPIGKAPLCSLLSMKATKAAERNTREDNDTVAGALYKQLQAAQESDYVETFSHIEIERAGNGWHLKGLSSKSLSNLSKWVLAIDQFKQFTGDWGKANQGKLKDLDSGEMEDGQPDEEKPEGDGGGIHTGDLDPMDIPKSPIPSFSMPGDLPGQATSSGYGGAPEFVQHICNETIGTFISKSKGFDVQSLERMVSKTSLSSSREPYTPVGVGYGADHGDTGSLSFTAELDFSIVAEKGKKITSQELGPDKAFVVGVRAVIACLVDLAAKVCPNEVKRLQEIDDACRWILEHLQNLKATAEKEVTDDKQKKSLPPSQKIQSPLDLQRDLPSARPEEDLKI
jgi:hypothetical protein